GGIITGDKDQAEEVNKSGDAEVNNAEIQNASYILGGQEDGEPAEDKEDGLLQIELQIENTSGNSKTVFPEQKINLYDGENQIYQSNDSYTLIGLEMNTNNDIGA